MAGSMSTVELQQQPKTVQELAASDSKQVPEKYIRQSNDFEVTNPNLAVLDIPSIDLQLLASAGGVEVELDKLRSALTSCGCIQAINHGIASEFLDKVREISHQFFALPTEEKKKYSREIDNIEGYGNDMILYADQTLDWDDRLYITISLEEKRSLKFWPEHPETFRGILHEYTVKLEVIIEVLLKAMARSLNLKENQFLNQCGDKAILRARFNFYPTCPRPDSVLGLKPHSDGSAITKLLQDKQVEGLQIMKHDEWFKVPVIPQALLVNVSDQVEIMGYSRALFTEF